MQAVNQSKRVLILGGTNFMGKALLDALSLALPTATLVCVNRGKIYWKNQARTQHPEVHNFYCDRNEHKDSTATIAFVSRHCKISQQQPWDLVVDFCAYKWRDVQSATKALAGITRLYVFISSDSVYNSSSKQLGTPIKEADFDIEAEYKRVNEAKNRQDLDKYGYNKLKCQIYLARIKPLPYVCLRLPDVIGPYDNTERMWCTVRWVRECFDYPLRLTAKEEYEQISLVDSESLAAQIVRLVDGPLPPSPAYNLSFKESFTLKAFLDQGDTVHPDVEVKYKAVKSGESHQFYPSVQCGTVSSELAIKDLGWNPLPFKEALKRAVQFFLKPAYDYPSEVKAMEKQYKKKVIAEAK